MARSRLTGALRRPRWPAASLRAYLVLVILVATVPLAAFAFYLLQQQAQAVRNQIDEAVYRSASAFALLVERELTSSIDLLSGLAYSEALQRGDIEGFHRILQRASPMRPGWRGVYLSDPDGLVIVASDQPLGYQMGRLRDQAALERIRTTLQPAVTDLVTVTGSDELVTAVQVPVLVRGELRYMLGARIAASHWQRLIDRATTAEGGFVSLTDGQSRMIANNPQGASVVGRVMPPEPESLAPQSPWHWLTSLAPAPFIVQQPMPPTSWTVSAGVPPAPLFGYEGTLAKLVVAGTLSLLLGLALAVTVARRVSAPLQQLADGCDPAQRVDVREIAVLHQALRAAAAQREQLMLSEREARRAAESANRSKDEFLATLGHELRNPLSAIAAAVEVLNRSQGHSDVAAGARRIIQRQTRHMTQLMTDLQDVARVAAGKLALERRRLDLAQLVWRALEALRLAGRLKGHVLVLDLHRAWVDADPTRMEQVIVNLLTNAAKYTPAAGRIALSIRRDGSEALIEVRDSGVGIAPALLPHVFEIFVQSESPAAHGQGSMGIGLALVRRLVELHGGCVQAQSEGPDCGSAFVVRLPAEAAPGAEPPTPCAGRHAVVIGADSAQPYEVEAVLCGAGCRVTSLIDPMAALDLIVEQQPHLAIVDIALPGRAAWALAARVREAGARRTLVVAVADEPPLEALDGFDLWLQRPIQLQELLQRLAATPADVAEL
jgi:signal transduction histidine kinase